MFSEPEKNLREFHIDPGMKVIDIGSGIGHYAFYLSKVVGENGKVYALDVQKDLLAKLISEAKQQHLYNIEVILGDIEKVNGSKVHDGYLDRAIISNVLFQIEHKDGFCDELKRILKKTGKILVVDWSESFGGMGPHPSHIFTKQQAKELFEKHGFTLEKEFDAGNHHYGLILKKA